jgi:prepilin-type N-terminal cleavage/methylation domain-containing protein
VIAQCVEVRSVPDTAWQFLPRFGPLIRRHCGISWVLSTRRGDSDVDRGLHLRMRRPVKDTGFSLVEVLVAMTILVVAVVSLAQLSVLSIVGNAHAGATTMTLLVAERKMEQLHGVAWGIDAAGLPVTDDTGLSPSPAGALSANIVGWVDYLDARGMLLDSVSTTPPAEAEYICRWSVEPLPSNPNNTLVLQVLVTRHRDRGAADAAPGVGRLPDEARLVTVKTRKAT